LERSWNTTPTNARSHTWVIAPFTGLNFFTDVAPCTAILDFQGRFGEFLASNETSIEPFEFVFSFPHGHERVSVVFVRLAADRDRATICVIPSGVAGSSTPK